jgi:hypothetical protein
MDHWLTGGPAAAADNNLTPPPNRQVMSALLLTEYRHSDNPGLAGLCYWFIGTKVSVDRVFVFTVAVKIKKKFSNRCWWFMNKEEKTRERKIRLRGFCRDYGSCNIFYGIGDGVLVLTDWMCHKAFSCKLMSVHPTFQKTMFKKLSIKRNLQSVWVGQPLTFLHQNNYLVFWKF